MPDEPAPEIIFQRFARADLGTYRSWFADAEISRFLSYRPMTGSRM
ncbi:hypothetical protein GFB56_24420 [Ensifer sp. T173]|uniref:N-acetyltransferase n=1 Tax=Ensifer canadensis TaxID=555315 RepID=A0AAW4FRI1_9HYPH|nr:hypothetical protein [Ensifer canadensis]MBM3093908.1 hypothetical protein [Ensifer canadensis]UBI79036.1 hypothetical protein J3R84_23265 [Ensifer canadensis]